MALRAGAFPSHLWRSIHCVGACNFFLNAARSPAKMLQTPRPELSCSNLKLRIYPSPDRTLHAVVYPADISLDVTPDMESRVVIRTSKGVTLTSQDYS